MMEKKTTPIKKKKQTLKNVIKDEVEKLPLPTPSLTDIIEEAKFSDYCKHPNLVPIEVAFIRVTHPNSYKDQPKVEFYIGITLATAFRVRKYYCPNCKEIIKAPSIYAEEKI